MGIFSKAKKIVGKVAGNLGPIASIGGGLMSGGLMGGLEAFGGYASAQQAYRATKEGAEQANEWAKEAAERQYVMQKVGYKNRYQWQMEDMERAGLNPLLAYQQGAGGAPSGASYTPVNTEAGALPAAHAGSQMASESVNRRLMGKTMKRINQDIKIGKEQEKSTREEAYLKYQSTRESEQRQAQIVDQQRKTRAEIKILNENLSSAKAAAAAAKHEEAFWKSDLGKLMKQTDLVGRSANPLASSAKSARGAM